VRGEPLTAFQIRDLGRSVRGRLMATADAPDRLATGIGCVPADYSITPWGLLADPNRYGPLGDLRLVPDRATHARVEFGAHVSPVELFLCDAVGTDGKSWDGCPRRFVVPADRETLRAAIRELVESTARAYGCRGSIELTEGEPVLDNDRQISSSAEALALQAGFAVAPPWRSCGSDDFAFFGQVAPSAMAFAGLAGAPGFAGYPLHHPEFLPPDEAVGAVARGQAVLFLAAANR
jgi:glutamine synthetase-like protein